MQEVFFETDRGTSVLLQAAKPLPPYSECRERLLI
jgi:hypothetical protein